MRKVQIGVVSK